MSARAMSPPRFTVRLGHAVVHTHSADDLSAALSRLAPVPAHETGALLPRRATYAADLLQAAAHAMPAKKARSLRDVAQILRGSAPREECRLVEQINAAYGLLRHVPLSEVDDRVAVAVRHLRELGEVRPRDDGPCDASIDPWAAAAARKFGGDFAVRRCDDGKRDGTVTEPSGDGHAGAEPGRDRFSDTAMQYLREQIDNLDLRRGKAAIAQSAILDGLEKRLARLEATPPQQTSGGEDATRRQDFYIGDDEGEPELAGLQDAPTVKREEWEWQGAPVTQREVRRQVHFAELLHADAHVDPPSDGLRDGVKTALEELVFRVEQLEQKLGGAALGDILRAVRDANAAQHWRLDDLQARVATSDALATLADEVSERIRRMEDGAAGMEAQLRGVERSVCEQATHTEEALTTVVKTLSWLEDLHTPPPAASEEGTREDDGRPHHDTPSWPPEVDEPPLNFAFLGDSDLYAARAASRRCWRALEWAFDPPPDVWLDEGDEMRRQASAGAASDSRRAPCADDLRESGSDGEGPPDAAGWIPDYERSRPPRYGRIGFGSGAR